MLEVLLSIIRKVAAIREPRETPLALLLFSISPFLGRGLSLGFARTSVSLVAANKGKHLMRVRDDGGRLPRKFLITYTFLLTFTA